MGRKSKSPAGPDRVIHHSCLSAYQGCFLSRAEMQLVLAAHQYIRLYSKQSRSAALLGCLSVYQGCCLLRVEVRLGCPSVEQGYILSRAEMQLILAVHQ